MPSYKVESNLLIVRAAGTLGSSTISPSGPTPNVVISKSNDLIQSSQNRLSFLVVSILLLSESGLSEIGSILLHEAIININNKGFSISFLI